MLKQQIKEYFIEHIEVYSVWGNIENYADKIGRDGVYAGYRTIRIASDFL